MNNWKNKMSCKHTWTYSNMSWHVHHCAIYLGYDFNCDTFWTDLVQSIYSSIIQT